MGIDWGTVGLTYQKRQDARKAAAAKAAAKEAERLEWYSQKKYEADIKKGQDASKSIAEALSTAIDNGLYTTNLGADALKQGHINKPFFEILEKKYSAKTDTDRLSELGTFNTSVSEYKIFANPYTSFASFNDRFKNVFNRYRPGANIQVFYNQKKEQIKKAEKLKTRGNKGQRHKGETRLGGKLVVETWDTNKAVTDGSFTAFKTHINEKVRYPIKTALNSRVLDGNNINDIIAIQNYLESTMKTYNTLARGTASYNDINQAQEYESIEDLFPSITKLLNPNASEQAKKTSQKDKILSPVQKKPPSITDAVKKERPKPANPQQYDIANPVSYVTSDNKDKILLPAKVVDKNSKASVNHNRSLVVQGYDSNHLFINVNDFDEAALAQGISRDNTDYEKSFLIRDISERFQLYSKNARSASAMNALRDDSEFHNKLIRLQELDPTFDAYTALGEAFLLASPTHQWNPNSKRYVAISGTEFDPLYGEIVQDPGGTGSKYKPTKEGQKKLRQSRSNISETRAAVNGILTKIKLFKEIENSGGGSTVAPTGWAAQVRTSVDSFMWEANRAKGELDRLKETQRGNAGSQTAFASFLRYAEKENRQLQNQYNVKGTPNNLQLRKYLIRSELLSDRIRMAYKLSAMLQGEGTGGGRTISDADFQYALAAIWGTTPQIESKLGGFLLELEEKSNRIEMSARYDRFGVSTRIENFLVPFLEKRREAYNRKRFDELSRLDANLSGSNDSNIDLDNRVGTLHTITDRFHYMYNENKFGSHLFTNPTQRNAQFGIMSEVSMDFLKDHAVTEMLLDVYTAKKRQSGLEISTFLSDVGGLAKAVKAYNPKYIDPMDALIKRLNRSLFPQEIIDNEAVPHNDSIFGIEVDKNGNHNLVLEPDTPSKRSSLFDVGLEQTQEAVADRYTAYEVVKALLEQGMRLKQIQKARASQ